MDQLNQLLSEVCHNEAKFGDIKKCAKTIKKDHELAMQLWATELFFARMLAVLILDKKFLDQAFIEQLASDISIHEPDQKNHLSEWLMANQLMKSKKTVTLLQSWQHHTSPTLRRLFWYHQARLRWTGQVPPENSAELMAFIEQNLIAEVPEVQWTMNFCAAQIGIHQSSYRQRCIELGEKAGLYKVDKVPKNCTPSYLPDFIRIEVAKREK